MDKEKIINIINNRLKGIIDKEYSLLPKLFEIQKVLSPSRFGEFVEVIYSDGFIMFPNIYHPKFEAGKSKIIKHQGSGKFIETVYISSFSEIKKQSSGTKIDILGIQQGKYLFSVSCKMKNPKKLKGQMEKTDYTQMFAETEALSFCKKYDNFYGIQVFNSKTFEGKSPKAYSKEKYNDMLRDNKIIWTDIEFLEEIFENTKILFGKYTIEELDDNYFKSDKISYYDNLRSIQKQYEKKYENKLYNKKIIGINTLTGSGKTEMLFSTIYGFGTGINLVMSNVVATQTQTANRLKKYIEFKAFVSIELNSKNYKNIKFDKNKTYIIFVSYQLLKGKNGKKIINELYKLKYNCCVFEESHIAKETIKSQYILDKLFGEDSFNVKQIVYVTATMGKNYYFNSLNIDDAFQVTLFDAMLAKIGKHSISEYNNDKLYFKNIPNINLTFFGKSDTKESYNYSELFNDLNKSIYNVLDKLILHAETDGKKCIYVKTADKKQQKIIFNYLKKIEKQRNIYVNMFNSFNGTTPKNLSTNIKNSIQNNNGKIIINLFIDQGGVGLDIPEFDCLWLLTTVNQLDIFEQLIGRLLRNNDNKTNINIISLDSGILLRFGQYIKDQIKKLSVDEKSENEITQQLFNIQRIIDWKFFDGNASYQLGLSEFEKMMPTQDVSESILTYKLEELSHSTEFVNEMSKMSDIGKSIFGNVILSKEQKNLFLGGKSNLLKKKIKRSIKKINKNSYNTLDIKSNINSLNYLYMIMPKFLLLAYYELKLDKFDIKKILEKILSEKNINYRLSNLNKSFINGFEKFLVITYKLINNNKKWENTINDLFINIFNCILSDVEKETGMKNINTHLIKSDVFIKKFGEVFTPIKLINEMLDKLPKELWSNPNLKWIDNSMGTGNFLVIVYNRLMNGLEKVFPNYDKRKKHILENMIYGVEIQERNVFFAKLRLDYNQKYKLNLVCKDSLEFNYWGGMKFDVIVGNPPYQAPQLTDNRAMGNSIWDEFVKLALNSLLKENGYLCYVHPSRWRRIEDEMWNMITAKQIEYLEIHSQKDGIEIFKMETRYDWYILKNAEYKEKTIVIDELGNKELINFKEWNFLPNYNFKEIKKYLAKNNEKKCNVLCDSSYHTQRGWVNKIKTQKFKYPCVYYININGKVDFYYSSRDDNGHFNIPKIIFPSGRICSVGFFKDKNGEYGMTQFCKGIVDKKSNLDKIYNKIKSKEFRDVMTACSVSTMEIDYKMFKLFKKNFYEIK